MSNTWLAPALTVLGFAWLAWIALDDRADRAPVYLPDLARKDPNGIVRALSFHDRTIQGPATIYPMGSTILAGNDFDYVTFATLDEYENRIAGAIGLLDCTFTRCKFQNIGVVGKAAEIAKMRAGIAGKELPAIETLFQRN